VTDPSEMLERLRRRWADRALGDAPTPRVTLDWRAYFRAFCEKHGRFPLLYRGRLLFPDAWQYSATDHAGPEWPPPDDKAERVRLMRAYWKLRRNAVRKTLPAARARLDHLQELVATHDLPVLQRVTTWDPGAGDGGAPVSRVTEVDLEAARQHVAWLERDLLVCDLRCVDPEAAEDMVERAPAVLALGETT
jgi:hypothetical protein